MHSYFETFGKCLLFTKYLTSTNMLEKMAAKLNNFFLIPGGCEVTKLNCLTCNINIIFLCPNCPNCYLCMFKNKQLKLNAFSGKDPAKGLFNIMHT